jgi:hypothetical protein
MARDARKPFERQSARGGTRGWGRFDRHPANSGQSVIIILQKQITSVYYTAKNVNSVANSRKAMTALRLRDSPPVADSLRYIAPGKGKVRREKIRPSGEI